MGANFMIIADDVLAVNDKIEEIKKGYGILSEDIVYNLAEEDIFSLIDELSTVSLFDETKFIVVKNAESLLAQTESSVSELVKAMTRQNSSHVVIFVFLEQIDHYHPIYQKVKKFCSVIELYVKNMNLHDYAKEYFRKEGYEVEDPTISLLVSYSDSLQSLRTFMDQVQMYKASEKKITTEDILKLVPVPLEDNVYHLIDAVLSNDKPRIIKGYQDMKLKSLQAATLIPMLLNKFQEIYNVILLVKNGFNQSSLAELLNVSSGRAYYMIKNAKEHSAKEISKQLDLLNRLDYQIKSGQIDANLGLELYFLR